MSLVGFSLNLQKTWGENRMEGDICGIKKNVKKYENEKYETLFSSFQVFPC